MGEESGDEKDMSTTTGSGSKSFDPRHHLSQLISNTVLFWGGKQFVSGFSKSKLDSHVLGSLYQQSTSLGHSGKSTAGDRAFLERIAYG
jgi:hypothetical protein